ncbi:MAG: hypothetical protein IIT73_02685, partial [Treponema sp.]|nr:hypothetical protein [Treponema sp.]
MKFSTPVCLRLFKFFIASAAIFAFSSCSNAEEEVSVSLNIPSSFCEQIAARPPFSGTSTGGAATEMKVFVTGDHEARKTVWLTPGADITLQFDGIKVGSYVRLVCLIEGVPEESFGTVETCKIFVGDEMPIYGKFKNAPKIKFEEVSISDNYSSRISLNKSLPGCTYKWVLGDGTTATTS